MQARPDETILILDFGSQYTQLITRKVRELGVYSEIKPFNISQNAIEALRPHGIILSGSPQSVYYDTAPLPDRGIFELNVPILGICYGLQLMAHFHGGSIAARKREYGLAELVTDDDADLLQDVPPRSQVWMSHGDALSEMPADFEVIAHTRTSLYAAIANRRKKIYGVQFHPEVSHTVAGKKILSNFVHNICGCEGTWTASSFVEKTIAEIREKVGTGQVLCALSGGVDSAVAAALVYQAVGDQLTCVYVNNGLMRKHETEQVSQSFSRYFNSNFLVVDASERFLNNLTGVSDPEEKRKVIGRTFIEVFEVEAKKLQDVEYLVQGTLYPDVIESVSAHGPSVTIKTHHNVGGLPEVMNLKLIEPLRELFKDEVRKVGRELNIPDVMLSRHPFPGPGLAVRILGEITEARLNILREVDAIFIEELRNHNQYDEVWQAFAVLLPVHSVGVMGDSRTYENVVALRAVTSVDGMTADWARIPYDLLALVSNRVINEVQGVNRVVYDISSKPPSTIEWE